MVRYSFRDPAGGTVVLPDQVLRVIKTREAIDAIGDIELGAEIQGFQAEGAWVEAEKVSLEAARERLEGVGGAVEDFLLGALEIMKHPRIFFPTYAHEWSPAMLARAAELTLKINERLVKIGWELKDGTPSNILFDGPRAVFVDHTSPSRRAPGQMGWSAYGQFARTFLIPLCLHQLVGLPLAWLYLARRDGVPAEMALGNLSWFDRLRPSVVGLITIPGLLSNRDSRVPQHGIKIWRGGDEEMGRMVTSRLVKGLQAKLHRWSPRGTEVTTWSEYDQAGESYSRDGLASKEAFVKAALEECGPRTALDLGCNTGRYSRLAARTGAKVVAVDGDASCVDRLWRAALAEGLDILPLVVDLGRPSPALGWENGEDASFIERIRGRFEFLLALALVHHLLVRERVPLPGLIAYLAGCTTRWAIIEWVPPEDPQFRRLSGHNQELYEYLTRPLFEFVLGTHFRIERTLEIPGGGRVVYLLEKTLKLGGI